MRQLWSAIGVFPLVPFGNVAAFHPNRKLSLLLGPNLCGRLCCAEQAYNLRHATCHWDYWRYPSPLQLWLQGTLFQAASPRSSALATFPAIGAVWESHNLSGWGSTDQYKLRRSLADSQMSSHREVSVAH
jgi:hypothetical protein